jgi:hypothetical protein
MRRERQQYGSGYNDHISPKLDTGTAELSLVAAAPDGPDTRPLLSAKAASILSFS